MPLSEPTVATLISLLLHSPPMPVLLSVILRPEQTEVAPDNVPETGSGFTVRVSVVIEVPQVFVTE